MNDNHTPRHDRARLDAIGLPSQRPGWARESMSPYVYEQLLNDLQLVCSPARNLPADVRRRLRVRIVKGWQERAACASADPEAWFPDTQGAAVKPEVVRICAACPVRRSCLATSLLWSVEGIWAGTTTRERDQLIVGMRVGTTDDDMALVLTEVLDQAADRLTRNGERHRWSGRDAA